MKKNIYIAGLLTFCILSVTSYIWIKNAQQVKTPETPIVIELFTSQGCPACPPADKKLTELARNKNIITLGCHVSYFNHGPWQDTLTQDFCDVRQHGIQGHRGERKIYTPQMIINGEYVFVGSNEAKFKFALDMAKQKKVLPIHATLEENTISIHLPQTETAPYHIWAFGYKNHIKTEIGGGHNSGHIIQYTTPAMTYTNLGPWDGNQRHLSFEKPVGDIDGITFFAQKNAYGRIVAAGRFDF